MSDALFEIDPHTVERTATKMTVRLGSVRELNPLLATQHYLGPLQSVGFVFVAESEHGEIVAGQAWKAPTSRRLPTEGRWLELSRWVLTPEAGPNAGSRFHGQAVRLLRRLSPRTTTLVSYSDPSVGHTGALYRACNWSWCPVWNRLRPSEFGGGAWRPDEPQQFKDRWVFPLRRDPDREDVVRVPPEHLTALRFWAARAPEHEHEWAKRSLSPQVRQIGAELGW